MNFTMIMGAIILLLTLMVLFQDLFAWLLFIGIILLGLYIVIRLFAEFYWYCRSKGW